MTLQDVLNYFNSSRTHDPTVGGLFPQAGAPLKQQAEQFGQGVAESPAGQLAQGKFGNFFNAINQKNQDIASGKVPFLFGGEMEEAPGAASSGVKPGSPVRVTLKPSVYGAGREAAVQNTVDTVVPGVTATEKYANLQPTMEHLGQQISDIMAQNPKVASLDQIMQDYDTNLRDQGIYRTTDAPKDMVQQMARKYITDLYNETSGQINPTQIDDSSLLKLKQQANQDAQSVYKKIGNNTSLTDKDRVVLAARQTLDDTLSTLHPEIKNLTTVQSHLYDAAEPLFDARETEVKDAQKAAQAAQQNTGKGVLNNLLGKILVGGATGLAGGAAFQARSLAPAAEVGIKGLMDRLNGNEQSTHEGFLQQALGLGRPAQANAQSAGSAPTQQASQSQQPRYSLPDPIQGGVFMDSDKYSQQVGDLQKELDYENQYKLPMAGVTKGKLDALKTQYDTEKPMRDAWSNPNNTGVSQQLTVANQAANAVQKADPGFFNALENGYDKLQTASNGKYAQMSKYLQYLGAQTGTDFTQYKTKDALLGAIDSAVENIKGNWQNQLKSYYGASSVNQNGIPQGPAGNNSGASQASPVQGAIRGLPPGFNFGQQL